MSTVPPIGAPAAAPDHEGRGRVAGWLLRPKTIIIAVLVALTVWFVLANSGKTRVHFWVVWVTARLWLVLGGTFLVGMLSGFLMGRRAKDKQPRD